MKNLLALILMFCVQLNIGESESNRYSAKVNDLDYKIGNDNHNIPSKDADKPFRMAKVNAVWHKAKKKLAPVKVDRIFKELIEQDKLEIESKHVSGNGKDKTGDRAGKVRQKMDDIMLRYGLFRSLSNELPRDSSQYLSEDENEVLDKEYKKVEKDAVQFNKKMMQKKLDTLWKKTQYAGFSEEDLKELRVEFDHHEHKLIQFYELATVPLGGPKYNNVKDFDDPSKIKNYKAQEYSDLLLYEFQRLEGKTYEKLNEKTGFVEIKVNKLWQLAKESNFTELELTSFKEELKHFENKLQKRDHYQDQLLHATQWRKSYGTKNDEKINQIKDKVSSMDVKAEKLHKELKRRIEMAYIKSEL